MTRGTQWVGWCTALLACGWLGLAAGTARAGEADSGFKGERSPVLMLGAARSTFGVGGFDAADPKPFWAPRLGLTYTAPRHAVTAFEFGLWADSRGGEWKDDGGALKGGPSVLAAPAYTHRLRLLYLSVPLMLRITLPSSPLTPYVKAGVAPSYLLSAREQTRETATRNLTRGFHGVRDEASLFHLDALAGVGVRTSLARHAFIVEALYQHGLTEVFRDQAIQPRTNLKNRTLQLFVGIGLRRERPGI
jgi:hypothetical protein